MNSETFKSVDMDKQNLITNVFRDPRVKRVGRPRKESFTSLFGEITITKPTRKPDKTEMVAKLEECIVDMSEEEIQPKRTRSGRQRRKFVGGADAGSGSDNNDDDDDYKPVIHDPPVKRGPGRPRKPVVENPDPPVKRKRGRPRKNPLPDLTTRVTKIRKSTSKKLRARATIDGVDIPQFRIFDDSDNDEDGTQSNFVFMAEPTKKIIPRGIRRQVELEKKEKFIKLDPFATPKKVRSGILQFNTTEASPEKKRLPILLASPKKPKSGRGGAPKKSTKEQKQQVISARRKANNTLYAYQAGVSTDEGDEEEIAHARKLQIDSFPSIDPTFVPTPLPILQADDNDNYSPEQHEDKALFLDGPDAYFDQHRFKPKASVNSMVMAPQLDYDEFNSLVLISGFLHYHQKQRLIKGYEEMFVQWAFQLETGFNLLFYGIGSKRQLLLKFVEDCLIERHDVPTLVINGYNTHTGFSEILKKLHEILGIEKLKLNKKIGDSVDNLVSYFSKRDRKVELIILFHNIDADQFRDEKIQHYLSKIASISQIQFVASIDHINGPVLWDSIRLANFNFVWHNITNFQDYFTEISFRDPLAFGQTQKSASSKAAKYVLSSLTSNIRSLYGILATNQLENMKEDLAGKRGQDKSIGHLLRGSMKHALEFKKLFQLCAEEFISSNEINFRTMLTEFLEHKMAILDKDASGTEMVYIPFTMDEITRLIDEELT
jgi:origin recognition complex subunit 2